jgi:dihydrofolate reductase
MQVSVFVGVSIDGFIARPDGGLDFLAPFEGEDHGYEEHMRSIDAMVVGRTTWETVLGVAIRHGLDEDLVDDMTISTVPRTIGAGIPLFAAARPCTTVWRLARTRSLPSGVVQSRWERAR